MFCFSLQKKIITIPNSMVLFFSTDLLRNSTHDLATPHYLDFNYHVSPQLSMGGTCVRLPYEESSIKMGNTQEVNVNKGVLDRVEARQDGAAACLYQTNKKILFGFKQFFQCFESVTVCPDPAVPYCFEPI